MPHRTAEVLYLKGACDYYYNLDGAAFVLQGTTVGGSPFYKAEGENYYIYFDPDCDGGSNGFARWLLDADAPRPHQPEDLDGDGACKYLARADLGSAAEPPSSASWLMYCREGWQAQLIHLDEVNEAKGVVRNSSAINSFVMTSVAGGFGHCPIVNLLLAMSMLPAMFHSLTPFLPLF